MRRSQALTLLLQAFLFVSPGFPAFAMQPQDQAFASTPKLERIFDLIRLDHIVAAITACQRSVARRQTLELRAGKDFALKLRAYPLSPRIGRQDLLVLSRCVHDARHECAPESCRRGTPAVR